MQHVAIKKNNPPHEILSGHYTFGKKRRVAINGDQPDLKSVEVRKDRVRFLCSPH